MAEPPRPDARPPARAALERAWAGHPQRALLERRAAERDAAGVGRWELFLGVEPEDETWAVIWQRPLDPREPREPIRVLRYPRSWEQAARADALARAEEHAED